MKIIVNTIIYFIVVLWFYFLSIQYIYLYIEMIYLV
jgi:hypothetical protein